MVDMEEKFKSELYKKYEKLKKVLIPKDQYFMMIEELKAISTDTKKKSREGYYLLSKWVAYNLVS